MAGTHKGKRHTRVRKFQLTGRLSIYNGGQSKCRLKDALHGLREKSEAESLEVLQLDRGV